MSRTRSLAARTVALALVPFAAACGAITTDSVEKVPEASDRSVYALEVESLEGESVPLERYRGQVALIVNTASQCGYTKQYAPLEELHQTYRDRGFTVLGFPSGDFGGQEFDTADEIRTFCTERYAVTFPLFAKSKVAEGEGQSPVFALAGEATGSLPGWNFGKYLVDREGRVVAFFPTPTDPMGDEIRAAVEAALGQG